MPVDTKLPMRIIAESINLPFSVEQQNMVISLGHLRDFRELWLINLLIGYDGLFALALGPVLIDLVYLMVF